MSKQVIFENENFSFVRKDGVGMNDTPYRELNVESKGLAQKHVVEVRLQYAKVAPLKWDGTPVVEQYSEAYVAHGMRMQTDTLQETKEYVEVLQDAMEFAGCVNNWLFKNDYHA